MSKAQITTLVLAVIALISLSVIGGCTYLSSHSAEIHKTVGTVLQIAYTSGGAKLVEEKIDAMVSDGKITAEQAVILKEAAQKSYEELQAKLAELSVQDVKVEAAE